MGRQIRFFLCEAMRAAIESEAQRIGTKLIPHSAFGTDAIEFSTSDGTDRERGRLWTEAVDTTHYDALCRVVKRRAVFDRDSMLWVKKSSLRAFERYRRQKQEALAALVEKNRKYAIEVLGARAANERT